MSFLFVFILIAAVVFFAVQLFRHDRRRRGRPAERR
jgi:large-conductance mechanosensitive channel